MALRRKYSNKSLTQSKCIYRKEPNYEYEFHRPIPKQRENEQVKAFEAIEH